MSCRQTCYHVIFSEIKNVIQKLETYCVTTFSDLVYGDTLSNMEDISVR